MDQDVIVEAIGKHLDMIETYVNAIAVLALAAGWAGVRRSREIEALGTKFDRRHAFWAVSALYLVGNMTILILFLRLGDLVQLFDPAHVVKGVTTIATHSWVLNPFSYFGSSTITKFHSSEGYGLLIATWWLCNASLSTLMDDKGNRGAQLLLGLFLAIGLGSMLAMNRVYYAVLSGLQTSAPILYTAASETAIERGVGNALGIYRRRTYFRSGEQVAGPLHDEEGKCRLNANADRSHASGKQQKIALEAAQWWAAQGATTQGLSQLCESEGDISTVSSRKR
jgi:hypothetical protein